MSILNVLRKNLFLLAVLLSALTAPSFSPASFDSAESEATENSFADVLSPNPIIDVNLPSDIPDVFKLKLELEYDSGVIGTGQDVSQRYKVFRLKDSPFGILILENRNKDDVQINVKYLVMNNQETLGARLSMSSGSSCIPMTLYKSIGRTGNKKPDTIYIVKRVCKYVRGKLVSGYELEEYTKDSTPESESKDGNVAKDLKDKKSDDDLKGTSPMSDSPSNPGNQDPKNASKAVNSKKSRSASPESAGGLTPSDELSGYSKKSGAKLKAADSGSIGHGG